MAKRSGTHNCFNTEVYIERVEALFQLILVITEGIANIRPHDGPAEEISHRAAMRPDLLL